MATVELFCGMPELQLTGGATLKLEAIDPATGAAVAGVVAKDFVIYGRDEADAGGEIGPLKEVYVLPTAPLIRPNPIPGRGD